MERDEAVTTDQGGSTGESGSGEPEGTDATALGERLGALEGQLKEVTRRLREQEMRRHVEAAAGKAGAVDASAVAEVVIAGLRQKPVEAVDEAAAAKAVQECRRRSPGLFRRGEAGQAASAMGANVAEARDDEAAAVHRAARRGDRRALMRYLKLRRGGRED